MTYVVVQFQKRKKKNQKYADDALTATKCWCLTALKTISRRKMKPPSYYTEFESSAFLGLTLTIS